MRKIDVKKTFLYTAVITPFNQESKIDFSELEGLLRDQERAENGIVILGSTGEGLALTEQEKLSVVKFTSNLNLSVPVLTGVSGFQLPQTLEFLAFAETQGGIDGYLMPVPLYAKPGLEGQSEWFTSLLNAVSKPTMIYNIPSRSGVKLHPDVLARLNLHKNAWAVKESSGSVAEFESYRKAGTNFSFYCGDDALMPEFAAAGAVGLVSVASNAWPEATHRYVDLCRAGKGEEIISVWKPACDSLFTASNPVPVKTVVKLQGRIKGASVRAPLSEVDLAKNNSLAQMDQAIKKWQSTL